MKTNRKQLINELNARANVRKSLLNEIRQEIGTEYVAAFEKEQLRRYIRKVLVEAKVADKVPHANTGINVLQDLLKKIIKIIEMGYKTLTTNPKQRKSFRAHILNAVQGSIAPPQALSRVDLEGEIGHKTTDLNPIEMPDSPSGDETSLMPDAEFDENPLDNSDLDELEIEEEPISLQEMVVNSLMSLFEAVEVDIKDDEDQTDDPIKSRAGQEGIVDIENDGKPVEEVDPKEEFTIDPDQDMTGRNVAFETFQKIENNVIDSYSLLSNDEDRQMFYKYLLVNLMLYFDRFEKELQEDLEEPVLDGQEVEQNSVTPEGESVDIEDIT